MMFMNIFWILILIVGIYFLVKWVNRSPDDARRPFEAFLAKSNNSLDILKERYARGEIDRAEYEEIRRDLTEA